MPFTRTSSVPPGSTIVSPTLSNPTITGTAVPTGSAGLTYPLAQSGAAVTGAADTNENTLATITVPANTLGANGAIRVTVFWSVNNNGNVKTGRVRFSGAAGTVYATHTLTSSTGGMLIATIQNANATNAQVGASVGHSFGGGFGGGGGATSAVDTTASTTVVITGQKATAGDTFTMTGYLAEVIRLS